MSSQKKRRENEKANKGTTPESRSFFRNVFSQPDSRLMAKKSRVPEKISKAFKDFLIGYKLKRDKLSIVKRNAAMWMIVKITGRYQATKQIGLRL